MKTYLITVETKKTETIAVRAEDERTAGVTAMTYAASELDPRDSEVSKRLRVLSHENQLLKTAFNGQFDGSLTDAEHKYSKKTTYRLVLFSESKTEHKNGFMQ